MSEQPAEQKPTGISLFELAIASIRAYAIYILLSSVVGAAGVIGVFLSGEWKIIWGGYPIYSSLSFFISVVAALFLLAKSEAIAKFILAGRQNPGDQLLTNPTIILNASSLVSAALTVVGISFLITGLQGLLSQGGIWLFAAKDEMTGHRPYISWDVSLLAGSTVRFIAGLVLVIGRRRVVGLFQSGREFFRFKDESDADTRDMPGETTNKDSDSSDLK